MTLPGMGIRVVSDLLLHRRHDRGPGFSAGADRKEHEGGGHGQKDGSEYTAQPPEQRTRPGSEIGEGIFAPVKVDRKDTGSDHGQGKRLPQHDDQNHPKEPGKRRRSQSVRPGESGERQGRGTGPGKAVWYRLRGPDGLGGGNPDLRGIALAAEGDSILYPGATLITGVFH